MLAYTAPLRAMRFLTDEVFDFPGTYARLGWHDVGADTIAAVLDGSASFCQEVLAPLNAVGDAAGCRFEDGKVLTPPGFKEAYEQFVVGGWGGLTAPTDFGGQELPESLNVLVTEMMAAANTSWLMYSGLTYGAVAAIEAHGSAAQKNVYLRKLIEGRWTGTMCLTEAHCGSDLGLIRTRALPQEDGSYAITGTKIFISAGEHDMSENIVHLVLAKLPDAPVGTRGISLFIVPKFIPDPDGRPGRRNAVSCGAIEEKMGIKASATCVMNFDSASGYLIGEANRGLQCMFTFMNNARLATAMQGLCLGERSYQGAVAYAMERLQMRSLSGPKAPAQPADPIIVHPDVRRMLLTMRAFNEGNRALTYYTARLLDQARHEADPAQRAEAESLLGLITPICKAFMTETGLEVTNLGMQVFGGHGFIRETGMEQLVRDCRIALIYEGTNGIQALDLLGRKVLANRGESLRRFTKEIHLFCVAHGEHPRLREHVASLAGLNRQWGEMTMSIGVAALENADEVGAAAMDYLMYSGYVTLAYLWLRMAVVADAALAGDTAERDFYEARLHICDFYFRRLLPRTASHRAAMNAGGGCLMAMRAEQFAA